ncbi:MAG: T9SS type A sorting domain-containing protein [Bacteroidales bacterium]|nr:T9SS type A sorting domain-containing protein [Bacteroidales bacterium]
MKKFTLFALALGLTFGAFAQRTAVQQKSMFAKSTGKELIKVKPVSVKANEVSITVESSYNAGYGVIAAVQMEAAEGTVKYGSICAPAGHVEQYIQSRGITVGMMCDSLADHIKWYGPDTTGKATYIDLEGESDFEIACPAIINEGADTVLVVKNFTSAEYLGKTANVTASVSNITSNSFRLTVEPDENTYAFFINVDYTDSLADYNQNNVEASQSILNTIIKYYNSYGQNNPVQPQQDEFDDEITYTQNEYYDDDLEENTTYSVHVMPVNVDVHLGNCFYTEVTTTADGLNEVAAAAVNVYPNPASDRVVVSSLSLIENVEMVNTLGQVVYTNNTVANGVVIPVNDFAKGTYFVKVRQNGKVQTSKVVVK